MDILQQLADLFWNPQAHLTYWQLNGIVMPCWSFVFTFVLCLTYASLRLSGMHVTKAVIGSVIGILVFLGFGALINWLVTGGEQIEDLGMMGCFFGFLFGWPICKVWLRLADARIKRLSAPQS